MLGSKSCSNSISFLSQNFAKKRCAFFLALIVFVTNCIIRQPTRTPPHVCPTAATEARAPESHRPTANVANNIEFQWLERGRAIWITLINKLDRIKCGDKEGDRDKEKNWQLENNNIYLVKLILCIPNLQQLILRRPTALRLSLGMGGHVKNTVNVSL